MARQVLGRVTRSWVDDLFIFSAIDMVLALTVVYLTDGRQSPYYLFAISTLLTPATVLGVRGAVLTCVAFVAAYVALLSTPDQELSSPYRGSSLVDFVATLALPVTLAIFMQLLASRTRKLAFEERRARRALRRVIRFRDERDAAVAEQERARIAREIHDGTAQSLYMVTLNLEATAEATQEPAIAERLKQLLVVVRSTLMEVRGYMFDLRPLLAGSGGLPDALREQVDEFAKVANLPVSLSIEGDLPQLSTAQSTAIYRIAQEALANVFQHADASDARLRLSADQESITLDVQDDGVGMTESHRTGRGLGHMQERTEALNGTLTIESGRGRGTKVRAVLPLRHHE
jgi:two-component system NarL family sensor kinase